MCKLTQIQFCTSLVNALKTTIIATAVSVCTSTQIVKALNVTLLSLHQLKQFEIIGRSLPSQKCPSPPLFKMNIFAPDEVVAKSKFWYFTAKLRKIKKMKGELVSYRQVSHAWLLVDGLDECNAKFSLAIFVCWCV